MSASAFNVNVNETIPQILTVSQVTRELRNLLETTYPQVWIEGEISNLRVVQSGHAYFTLKDANSQLRTVMFRSAWRQLPFTPEAGMQVVAQGRLSIYEPRGDYQLLAQRLEPQGVGALQLAYEQLRDRLFQEGLFDEDRKRPLPMVPQQVGIVTSPTGAAIRDIIQIVHRRRANVHLHLYPVRVQGKEAAQEIATAIAALNRYEPRPEVLIVGRGGGSLEDLWSFNEEIVARAIAASDIPVISAVGHEIDYTIADFVSDLRASTPSAAAELVVKSEVELNQLVTSLLGRIQAVVKYNLERSHTAYDHLLSSRPFKEPYRLVQNIQQQVDDLTLQLDKGWKNKSQDRITHLQIATRSLERLNPRAHWQRLYTHLDTLQHRLENAARSRLTLRGETLAGFSSTLQSLSPLAVLARGYSVCREPVTQALISTTANVQLGQQVEVLLYDGQLHCTVNDIHPEEPNHERPNLRRSS